MIYQVFNAHGANCMAEGDSEAEAIENARPMFASNVIFVGRYSPPAPNPLFAQVGMRAMLLSERTRA
jgi:hypothetical protein